VHSLPDKSLVHCASPYMNCACEPLYGWDPFANRMGEPAASAVSRVISLDCVSLMVAVSPGTTSV
jgi:hypothetical protein